MPIKVTWDDSEQTLLRMDIAVPVSWDIFDSAMDEVANLAQTVAHRVDVMLITGSVLMPAGSPLPHLRRGFQNLPKNVNLIVASSSNQFAKAIASSVGQIFLGHKFKMFGSLEESREYINRERAKA